MIHLPFFNRYPYTNYEQINLDWLMSTAASFESRVETVEKKVEELDDKVDTFDGRITTNTDDITDLKRRMTTAEGDIDDLETDVNTAKGDINDLKGRMTTAEGDIDDLESDMSTAKDDINDLKGRMTQAEADIDAIPEVEGNPGGTVTGSLTTLRIGDTIYQITGGGGGQGTEVIANPSGTAVADLDTVSIAGIIYNIPSTDISGLEDRVSDLEDVVGDSTDGLVKDINDLEAADTVIDGRLNDLEGDMTDVNALLASGPISFTNYRDNCQLNQSYDIASGLTLPAGTYVVEFDIYVSFAAATLATHPGYYQLWAGYLKEDGTRPGLAEEIVVTSDAGASYTHFVTSTRIVQSTGSATLSIRTHVNGPYYAGTSNATYHLSVEAKAIRIR